MVRANLKLAFDCTGVIYMYRIPCSDRRPGLREAEEVVDRTRIVNKSTERDFHAWASGRIGLRELC